MKVGDRIGRGRNGRARRPLTAEQQQLVKSSAKLVERVAALLAPRFPGTGRDEAISLGHVALAEAARRYDSSNGTPFEGYAWSCVYWSVHKGLRREVVARRRLPGLEDASCPTDPSEASADAVHDAAVGDASRRAASEPASDVEERARRVSALELATSTLSDRERRLIQRRYHDEADFYSIAGELNVSYATVRRAHVGALRRLAELLAA